MRFIKCSIDGLVRIEPSIWEDSRGFFMETYNQAVFDQAGIRADFVQDNLSLSHKGVLRGLHAQTEPYAQGKLVRVIRGSVFDVAVDIRAGSPTFGRYHSIELSAANRVSFWIPPGFLHGFLALEDDTLFTYKVTNLYDRESELGVRWDDPDIAIQWPSEFEKNELIISEKDQELPLLRELDNSYYFAPIR